MSEGLCLRVANIPQRHSPLLRMLGQRTRHTHLQLQATSPLWSTSHHLVSARFEKYDVDFTVL